MIRDYLIDVVFVLAIAKTKTTKIECNIFLIASLLPISVVKFLIPVWLLHQHFFNGIFFRSIGVLTCNPKIPNKKNKCNYS